MILIFLMVILVHPFSKAYWQCLLEDLENVQPYASCWKSQILKNSMQPNVELFWAMKMRLFRCVI